jgi:hypothetical protein
MVAGIYRALLVSVLLPIGVTQLQASIRTTATTLAITPNNTVNAGTVVNLTADVTNPGTVTKGVVRFCNAAAMNCDNGAGLIGVAQLTTSGTATVRVRLGVGVHNIKAVFSGTEANTESTSTIQVLSVVPTGSYPSTTTLISNGSEGSYTLSGSVSAFGNQPLTGAVRFLDTTNGNWQVATTTLTHPGWTFTSPTNSSVSPSPWSVAVGDLNRDGIPDVVVANPANNTVRVLLGEGDGIFRTPVSYASGFGPDSVAIGDFNGDGMPDLVVANLGSRTVSVLLGNGDGTFQPQISYATGSNPWSVAVGDVSGDGIPDLAVANQSSNTVSVLLGNGDGTFQPQISDLTGANPWSVAIGDFNGDGKSDLAVANEASNTVSILLSNGDGTFQPQASYSVGSAPESVAIGDFNGDGQPDLAVANYVSNSISVLLGSGDGTFQPQISYAAGYNVSSVAVGDFNGDGIPDLATVNYNYGTASVLLGNGDGSFQTRRAYPIGNRSLPLSVAVADFNGDGMPDIAATGADLYVILGEQTANYSMAGVSVRGNGTHNVVAIYSGDSNRAASQSNTVALMATPASSNLALTSSPSSLLVGQTATISAKLQAGATGTVSFAIAGNTTVVPIDSTGTAKLGNQFLGEAPGSYVITASYSGDTTYAPSSASYTETISDQLSSGVALPSQPALVFVPAQITTIIGTGAAGDSGDGGAGISARINQPFGTALDSIGNVYISDQRNNIIRKLAVSTGIITTLAGTETAGYSGDGGPAADALLNHPGALSVDQSGNVYFADMGNNCVRKIAAFTDVISTVAGTCTVAGYSGDGGVATAAVMNRPVDVLVDSAENLYVSDYGNSCIRKVAAGTKTISTIAGRCSVSGFSGDGGNATDALMSPATSIALDNSGNLYIADTFNNRIRKVDAARANISTFMGTGSTGFNGDGGPASSAMLNAPSGLSFDGMGNLYIADQGNNVIRMVDPAGLVVSTVAGRGAAGLTGDGGPATAALLNGPTGLTVSPSGTIYIADQGNNVVRMVGPSGVLAFPSQPMGTTSVPQTVTIANRGSQPLTFSAGPITTGDFSIGKGNTCGITTLAAGAKCTVAVVFSPTAAGSRSGTVQFKDNGVPSAQTLVVTGSAVASSSWITLASSINPSTYGTLVTFTASVVQGATGTVTFKDDGVTIGTGTIVGGVASFSTSSLTTGTHPIAATYGGDSNYSGSTSSALTYSVDKAPSEISVESSENPSTYGNGVTITVMVNPKATGTVTFTDGAVVLGTATLNSSGRGMISISTLAAGSHSIVATYSGDKNYY